jgi:DNA-binding transcriptional ArsR family regulator
MRTEKVSVQLAAIAHDCRLGIISLLAPTGLEGMAAAKIAERLDIAPASLTFHLKKLSSAQLITSRSQGRHIIYSVNSVVVNRLIGYLAENCGSEGPDSL